MPIGRPETRADVDPDQIMAEASARNIDAAQQVAPPGCDAASVEPATPLIKGVLEKLALLEGVGKETVSELALQSSVVRAARGEMVVRRGERVPSLYAVACGAVKARFARPHGGENVLALLGPGATFGKTAVLLARPSFVDVVALEETTLVATRAACILALFERNLRFSRNLARALAERNQNLLGELEAGRMPSAQRLAAYLDSIAEPAAPPGGAYSAHLTVSKTLLAARLGIKKETLSRLLREFARADLITVAGRDIGIRDAARLRQLAARGLTCCVQTQAPGD
jgi:CRP/FNR family transcriptional regulator, dissimilatory nitrate respiration regulator